MPFDVGLAKLIPKPGVRASQTVHKRMTRFKAFMIDRYQAARPEQNERERMIEVEARIAAMERGRHSAAFIHPMAGSFPGVVATYGERDPFCCGRVGAANQD